MLYHHMRKHKQKREKEENISKLINYHYVICAILRLYHIDGLF